MPCQVFSLEVFSLEVFSREVFSWAGVSSEDLGEACPSAVAILVSLFRDDVSFARPSFNCSARRNLTSCARLSTCLCNDVICVARWCDRTGRYAIRQATSKTSNKYDQRERQG